MIITTITSDNMADPLELQRLAWFSPAFPVGGYAYSHGIEKAVETGDVVNPETLADWIADVLRLGAGRNDAILIAEAWRRGASKEISPLIELAELGAALGVAAERRLETTQQGAAFLGLVHAAFPHGDLPAWPEGQAIPYPVAVGMAGRVHGQPLKPLIAAYLQAFASNLIAAGIRLAIIGQSEAQVRLAGLMPVIAGIAGEAEGATPADLGGMAFRADLMAMRHETQTTRLFRS